ncbi:MAG TPA: histidine kinase [Casimicrobiaceae bacterium]|nr:histidine kinase [Casimicrobiaceae bacterium]
MAALARGFKARPMTLALIVAINTGIALILWNNDPRPFWHPLLTTQIYGLCIAYAINVVAPWDKPRPMLSMLAAIAIAVVAGVLLVILLKGYSVDYVRERWMVFAWNIVQAFLNGLLISLLFFVKFRETRAAEALHRAESERNLLAKQAVEAELKLMQAQVEPHFLFNTLASVQFLTETDPPQAHRLLGHLIAYLRAALPQFRAHSSTLGREIDLAAAYLEILKIRMGSRLAFQVSLPPELASHAFPPNMLISLVENAIKHGVEPAVEGGTIMIDARREADRVVVTVTDSGRGLSMRQRSDTAGDGVGLSNLRERLAALFGQRGRFTIEDVQPHGARAIIAVPHEQQ